METIDGAQERTRQRLGEFLSPQQLAEYLDVSVNTIYGWRTSGGGPPGARVGRHVRYKRADVDRWFDEQVQAG